ncbi:MAG: hypothetical protein JXR07_03680 [Reichenbachiella sp.]
MFIYSIIVLLSYMNGMMHAFHISISEIKHNTETKTLDISQKIFLDDLEEGLILWSGERSVDVTNPKDPEKLDSLIASFVLTNFEVEVDEKRQVPKFLGARSKDDVMMVFLQVDRIKKFKTISIKNSVLMELFMDQINLVHITKDDELKSIKLDTNNSWGKISWE